MNQELYCLTFSGKNKISSKDISKEEKKLIDKYSNFIIKQPEILCEDLEKKLPNYTYQLLTQNTIRNAFRHHFNLLQDWNDLGKNIARLKKTIPLETKQEILKQLIREKDLIATQIYSGIQNNEFNSKEILKYCYYPEKMLFGQIKPLEYFNIFLGEEPLYQIEEEKQRIPIHLINPYERKLIKKIISQYNGAHPDYYSELENSWFETTRKSKSSSKFNLNRKGNIPILNLIDLLNQFSNDERLKKEPFNI